MTPAETTELRANAARLGVALDDRAIIRVGRFLDLLEIWNRRFRLTGDRDRRTLLAKHVVDSLALALELPPDGPVLDIGTGAGFPGIVLACVWPDRMLALLDPRRRPTSFLLEASRTIPLPNVRVIEARAQDACRDPTLAGGMAAVVSRAVKLETLLDVAPPFLRREGGTLVAMQSQSLGDRSAREHGLRVGMKLLRIRDYRLPGGESRRLLVFGWTSEGD